MNGQGQFLGLGLVVEGDFNKCENDSDLNVLLCSRGTRTVSDFRIAVGKLPIYYYI